MPLQATSGAASYDAFGGGVAAEPNYIESCFSTWLYTGNGSTQTITNGIDLAGKGGLVWVKSRSTTYNNSLVDSARGLNRVLVTNSTAAQGTMAALTFNSNGFTLPNDTDMNGTGQTFASWTFREQPKFFDVVTYTGNGTTNDVAHALGSVPGMVIIKKTSTTSNWYTLNRDSSGNYVQGYLNTTGSLPQAWTSANTSNYLTSTTLKIASLASITGEDMNASGTTYVAYLFAHNAGGFGLTGTDNVISCGSFTTNSNGDAAVNLGYEPQWVMVKNTTSNVTGGWNIIDNMRGWTTINGAALFANTTDAEITSSLPELTATGFNWTFGNSAFANTGYIYIAIRRGPMKVPTTGTSVFAPLVVNNAAGTTNTTGFPVDLQIFKDNRAGTGDNKVVDRLRGVNTTTTENTLPLLVTNSTAAEDSSAVSRAWNNTGFQTATAVSNSNLAVWNWRRAPGFFDEVCYSGTGANLTVNHNLGVVPELAIMRLRASTANWAVSAVNDTRALYLNSTQTSQAYSFFNSMSSTSVNMKGDSDFNTSGGTAVMYLFASCPGVSRVGTFTGTGATQVINCGFTGGARFVLIKATSTTGNWLVWDSARGIVSGNDPYLALNSTAAEVTNTDWVDTAASGFELSNAGGNLANSNGVSYVFLAVA